MSKKEIELLQEQQKSFNSYLHEALTTIQSDFDDVDENIEDFTSILVNHAKKMMSFQQRLELLEGSMDDAANRRYVDDLAVIMHDLKQKVKVELADDIKQQQRAANNQLKAMTDSIFALQTKVAAIEQIAIFDYNKAKAKVDEPKPFVGMKAQKVGGSFEASGTVVAEFKTTSGQTRVVFEFDTPKGMLHIYNPDQLVFHI